MILAGPNLIFQSVVDCLDDLPKPVEQPHEGRMRAEGERVEPTGTIPVAVRDPEDVHLLAAALGGNAAYLVTGDADLPILNGDPALGPLRIVAARAFLDALARRRGGTGA
jgi:hypothetical protein